MYIAFDDEWVVRRGSPASPVEYYRRSYLAIVVWAS